MNTFDSFLEQILALLKTPQAGKVTTSLGGNTVFFTILQAIPCSPDICCIFVDKTNNSLYALQNTGSQFWIRFSNEINEEETKDFLLPVTNFLMKNKEDCIKSFIKTCRLQDLGGIPIREDSLINPFIPKEILEKLTPLPTN